MTEQTLVYLLQVTDDNCQYISDLKNPLKLKLMLITFSILQYFNLGRVPPLQMSC